MNLSTTARAGVEEYRGGSIEPAKEEDDTLTEIPGSAEVIRRLASGKLAELKMYGSVDEPMFVLNAIGPLLGFRRARDQTRRMETQRVMPVVVKSKRGHMVFYQKRYVNVIGMSELEHLCGMSKNFRRCYATVKLVDRTLSILKGDALAMKRLSVDPRQPKKTVSGSQGERQIARILTDAGIQYTYDEPFGDLVGDTDRPLRFDFRLTVNNMFLFIEYDGYQHTQPATFGGVNESEAQHAFEKIQRYDAMKNQFCASIGCPLLRINPWQLHCMEEMIFKFITDHTSWSVCQ